ncbi:MAG TPA: O-antigen ligase family protein [Phycisphaerae bacterium]|nr:O-antigen ligase family protein [Phycisphaerae bacterium]
MVGVVLGVCWLVVGLFIKGQEIRWVWPISLYLLFAVWAVTGLFVTAELTFFTMLITTLAKVAGVTWICLQCVQTRRDVLFCYFLLGFASLIVLYQGIDAIVHSIEFAGEKGAKDVRAGTTLLANANDLGEFGVITLVGVTACVMGYKNTFVRVVSLGFGVAALYIIAASGSRTAMLGTVTFATALYFFHFRNAGAASAGRRVLLVFLSLFLVAASAYFVAKLPFFYRLQEVFSSRENLEKEPRVEYFFRAIESTAQHPVFGLGLGGFAMARLGVGAGGKGHYSHSTVSETLSCTGIPGFLLYYGAQFAFFRILQRTRRLPLPKPDKTMVNIIMAHFWVYLFFSTVVSMDSHRLAWPLVGGLLGYVWSLNKRYAAASPSYATA